MAASAVTNPLAALYSLGGRADSYDWLTSLPSSLLLPLQHVLALFTRSGWLGSERVLQQPMSDRRGEEGGVCACAMVRRGHCPGGARALPEARRRFLALRAGCRAGRAPLPPAAGAAGPAPAARLGEAPEAGDLPSRPRWLDLWLLGVSATAQVESLRLRRYRQRLR